MEYFFKVKKVKRVHLIAKQIKPLPFEKIEIFKSLGRVLAFDLFSSINIPGFIRSTVDGYAVYAPNTFGSSENEPSYLSIVGEILMGKPPTFKIKSGECALIGTGGMLPTGANAVVMLEYTNLLKSNDIEINKPVAPSNNILKSTDDAKKGQLLLRSKQRLRPQDLGLFATLGLSKIQAIRRPSIGIISTGNEIVPIEKKPNICQIRDVNTYTLFSLIKQTGGIPNIIGLIKDDKFMLKKYVEKSIKNNDLTLISGGSSVGMRDYTAEVFLSLNAEILVHGVAASPGKPFIWAKKKNKHLIGLPGQVTSCMLSFYMLVEPIIETMLGRSPVPFTRFNRVKAKLNTNVFSVQGREDYVRVQIKNNREGLLEAIPILGKSGLIRTLIQGDGLIKIPENIEGFEKGDLVEVLLFPQN